MPISFGLSSLALLHVLDGLIRRHLKKSNRAGYELHILHVQEAGAGTEHVPSTAMELLESQYPGHRYITLPIQSNLEHQNRSVTRPAEKIGNSGDSMPATVPAPASLEALLLGLDSVSSQDDLIGILRKRSVSAFAKEDGLECIAWGDSTTRLAERTLAETAKGRGFSLPWQTSDAIGPDGILSIFPMRDLLRKEIINYSNLTTPPLTNFYHDSAKAFNSVSSKATSIDSLIGQYFESVENNYPSIVANVVRTSSKLKPLEETSTLCQICSLPIQQGMEGIENWDGYQTEALPARGPVAAVCYGCARSFEKRKGQH